MIQVCKLIFFIRFHIIDIIAISMFNDWGTFVIVFFNLNVIVLFKIIAKSMSNDPGMLILCSLVLIM